MIEQSLPGQANRLGDGFFAGGGGLGCRKKEDGRLPLAPVLVFD
jgi:hypothetical protein